MTGDLRARSRPRRCPVPRFRRDAGRDRADPDSILSRFATATALARRREARRRAGAAERAGSARPRLRTPAPLARRRHGWKSSGRTRPARAAAAAASRCSPSCAPPARQRAARAQGPVAALHFRAVPRPKPPVAAAEACGASAASYAVQPGKMVVEVKPPPPTRGAALARLMARPPFAGRRPIMLGDDQPTRTRSPRRRPARRPRRQVGPRAPARQPSAPAIPLPFAPGSPARPADPVGRPAIWQAPDAMSRIAERLLQLLQILRPPLPAGQLPPAGGRARRCRCARFIATSRACRPGRAHRGEGGDRLYPAPGFLPPHVHRREIEALVLGSTWLARSTDARLGAAAEAARQDRRRSAVRPAAPRWRDRACWSRPATPRQRNRPLTGADR